MPLMSPALVLRFFTTSATWEALGVPEDPQSEHVENQSQHPGLQTNFPFSVNNAASTWSPKRETGRHSEHPGPPEPESLLSPALAGGFFTTSTTWEAHVIVHHPDISVLSNSLPV